MLGWLILLSALALGIQELAPAVWAADVVLVAALVLDFVRTPSPTRLVVDRSLPEKVGLSREFTRSVVLELAGAAGSTGSPRSSGPGRHRPWVEVHEEFPRPFRVTRRTVDGRATDPLADDPSGGPDVARFSEEGRVRLERGYRSELRGAFEFGDLRLRLRGPLGLVERQGRLTGRQPVAIEPALAGLSRTLRLAASDRWQDLGVRLLRRRGGETEFESLREYIQGDDVRRMDWKAFAHRGKPMVRQYQVERGQELILLIDRGRRMRVATALGEHRGWTKLDWALDTGLQLAAVALAKADRVGVATFERELDTWVAPAKGSRQLARLQKALFELQPSDQEADLGRALRELAARHRRSATVIVISDVADPLSVALQRAELRAASRRHRIVFAALDDPGLRVAAAGDGPVAVRAAALELVEDRRRSLAQLATRGVRVLDALPAEAAAPLLAAWLAERRR